MRNSQFTTNDVCLITADPTPFDATQEYTACWFLFTDVKRTIPFVFGMAPLDGCDQVTFAIGLAAVTLQ